ncbi:TIMELESS-interacting protein [Caerostris darwini]|uniref:TIMELESS-interacting protein n=1 Tax=Caerostris darwini TaxID=1538125 RepID=A0AAV4W0B0_9ARAC|nr:TIMELESS-interacting protein [Caerostris darwini]
MEENGDDLDDIFDEYESNAPPLIEENVNNENETAAPEPVPVPKRIVKPRVKLNPERLCGKRGIPILKDHFKDVKFRGKGHEEKDLKTLLTNLELWTHRLFPSMKFEDCLQQIEKLGCKRPVKTCVQKIRLDFPILAEDFVHAEEEEKEEAPNEMDLEPPPQDAFDRLFNDYQQTSQPVLASTPSSSQAAGKILGSSFGSGLSEEQKKRMEYNKLLATERRKARLAAMQSNNPSESTANSKPTNHSDSAIDYLNCQFENAENSQVNDKSREESVYSSLSEIQRGNAKENTTYSESLFDDLNQQVKHPESSVVSAKSKSESINSDHPIDSEQLELEELMDLVDDKNQDENKVNLSSLNQENNEESTFSPQPKIVNELGVDVLMDMSDKENHEKESNIVSANNESREESVYSSQSEIQRGNEKENATYSQSLFNDLNQQFKDSESPAMNVNSKSDSIHSNQPIDSKQLELDELMDLVDDENQNENEENNKESSFSPQLKKLKELDNLIAKENYENKLF